jgi:hypothetical protein
LEEVSSSARTRRNETTGSSWLCRKPLAVIQLACRLSFSQEAYWRVTPKDIDCEQREVELLNILWSVPIPVPHFSENVWVNSRPSRERETWRTKRQEQHNLPSCLPAQRFLYARSIWIAAPPVRPKFPPPGWAGTKPEPATAHSLTLLQIWFTCPDPFPRRTGGRAWLPRRDRLATATCGGEALRWVQGLTEQRGRL